MRTYFFVIICFLLASCGRQKDVVPAEVESTYRLFVEKAEHYGSKLKSRSLQIYFINTPKNEVAQCEKNSDLALIRISPAIWKSASSDSREMILFHELGHCLLDRDHTDGYVEGRPRSIMHSYGVNSKHFGEHKEDYFRELFTSK